MTPILLGLLLLLASQSEDGAAFERAPAFSDLPSARYDSAVSMQCEGEAPFDELICLFTRVEVEESPGLEMPEYRALAAQYFDKAFCAAVRSNALPEDTEPAWSAAKIAWFTQLRSRRLAVCACLGRPCLDNALGELLALERRGCIITTSSYSIKLTRVPGQSRWTSAPTPYPLCGIQEVHDVERIAEHQWRYTVSHRTAGDESPNCQALEEVFREPSVYSSDTQATSLLHCEYMHFGPHWIGTLRGEE
jgi:hypothetical protein